jgi:ABC-type glycerol-3-phosphate transport system permease component
MTDVLAPKLASPKAVLSGVTADHTEGMSYLQTLPRRLVTLYLPLSLILFVLLFPFYWMALTAIKPDEQLLDLDRFNPFWPSILFIPLATVVFQYGLFDSPLALILTYPTILIPFSTWLLMGYFKTIPFELEECALIDGASRYQILTKIVLPLAIPGLISAFIFCFTLCWNEYIYALTFISSTEHKTVPVAIVNEFVDGDIYRWGSLMAGALVGSLPLVVLYAFFVEHYVSAMTGAVKE